MSDAWKTVGTRVIPVHIDGSPKDFPYVRPPADQVPPEVQHESETRRAVYRLLSSSGFYERFVALGLLKIACEREQEALLNRLTDGGW